MPKAIPDEFRGATPLLAIKNAPAAIEFYKKAFGATELMRLAEPNGTIAHAEIRVGSAVVMIAEENPQFNKSPATLKGTSVILMVYFEDVDRVFNQAVSAGAKVIFPLKDQFYGDRSGRVEDPFGHMWMLATHKEDLSADEMQRRFNDFFK